MIVGALIIFFLIVEPHGLARLWQIGKQKLRVWPFPVLMGQTAAQFPPRADTARRGGMNPGGVAAGTEKPARSPPAGRNEGRNAMQLQAPRSRRCLRGLVGASALATDGAGAGQHLCAAAHLPHRPVRRLAAFRSPTACTTISPCSTSATAASAASRSSIEECETGYDTKKGVECYEHGEGEEAGRRQPVFDRHHAAAHPEGGGRQDPGAVDGLRPLGLGRRQQLPVDLQSAGDLLGRRCR